MVSSGATMPARAPASMDMLQIVIRSSIERLATALPRYSMTWPVPPPTPIVPITRRITSFAVTPGGNRPFKLIARDFGLRCSRHCVASTWPTSVVPMPNASAPNAPCVLVCESPQTIVVPGWLAPSSGPITCTMPRCGLPKPRSSMPKSRQFCSICRTCLAAAGTLTRSRSAGVGTATVGVE